MAGVAAADSHDTEGLKAALVASEARAAAAEAKVSDAEAEFAALTLMIEKLRRALYGRRSERKERLLDQLELALDELTASATEDELAAGKAAARTTEVSGFVRRKPSRKPFPEHLPRERVVVPAPTSCACCGSDRLSKVEAIAAPEDDDRGAAQGQRPSAQDRAEVGDPESGAGGSACQASRDQEGTRVRACRASSGQEDVVEVAVRCRRRSPQGSAKVAAPEGHDQVAVPGERPAAQGREDIAEPDRDAGSPAGEASRDQSSAVESALRPQERAAGQARNASAASSAARPATAAPSGPGSRSAPKSTTRRPMRASADGAGSPMRRTAPRNPPSSRSRSRPTSG